MVAQMRRAVVAGLCVLSSSSLGAFAACGGSVGVESARPPEGEGGTAPTFGTTDARPPSKPDDLRRCLRTGFNAPVSIPGFATSNVETSPHLTSDELTIVFSRLDGERGFYVATRPSRAMPFSTPVRLPVDGDASDADPMMAPDGLALFFTSSRASSVGGSNIWVTRRASRTEPFGAPVLLDGASSTSDDYHPFAVPGGGLWLASTRKAAGRSDIFFAPELADGGLGEPLTSNLSAGVDGTPVPSADGLRLYFSSRRPPSQLTDIWAGARSVDSGPFEGPVQVAELDSSGNDVPGWVSPDDCRMYFHSDRGGAPGQFHLYVAARPGDPCPERTTCE